MPPPSPAPLPNPAVTEPVREGVEPVQQLLNTPVSVLEEQMLNLINADRAGAGLRRLEMSGWAQSFARGFSQKMMEAGTIWHNPEYFTRGRAAMAADLLAENVGYDSSIISNHLGFMASPSHRKNILDGRLTHVGIGVAVSPDGRVYVTEDFARIPGSAAPANTGADARRGSPASKGAPAAHGSPAEASAGSEGAEVAIKMIPATENGSREADKVQEAAPSGTDGPGPSQSPAPMIPGLVTGGIMALLAPLTMLGKKLILALSN